MQIVIDIPDDYKYRTIGDSKEVLFDAVRNGIMLPKGHGKLIDGDLLNRTMYHNAFETDTDFQKWDSGCWIRYKMFENVMKEIPTVIPADKGEE